MANTVTSQILLDGSQRLVIKWYLSSDGVAGEVTDQVVVDVSALTPAATKVSLERVIWSLTGFDAILEWDATADVEILRLGAAASTSDLCMKEFGGIWNNAGAGITGDMLLTTSGFTAVGDAGTIILICTKNT